MFALETCTLRREAAAMEWILLADVELPKASMATISFTGIDHLAAAGLRITKKEIILPKVENSVLGFAGYRAQKRRVGNAKNLP